MAFRLSPRAAEDFATLKNHLRREAGTAVALRLALRIQQAARTLSNFPELGHVRQDLTDRLVRFHPVPPYMIIYDPTARPLIILRILHERQNIAPASLPE